MALLPRSTASKIGTLPHRTKLAILVPAHNEASGMGNTLASLLPQVTNPDNIVVVADNCTDNTAAIAREYGVRVIERDNKEQRGKGYALDYGIRYLETNPPEIVIFIDADCRVEPGAIQQLTQQALVTGRPTQALYLLDKPPYPTSRDLISSLAFLVKNQVRPTGLSRLRLPCILVGTGMAFPWSVIQKVPLASGNIVEDMQLGIDLTLAGYSPLFCPDAQVTGMLPQQASAAKKQRTRWEHGHLKTLLNQVPRLLQEAIKQGRFDLLSLALELSVPPLSLLVMFWVLAMIGMVLAGLLKISWIPAIIVGIAGLFLVVGIFSALNKFVQKDISSLTLWAIPLYLAWKIPIYLTFLIRPESQWVRTERDKF